LKQENTLLSLIYELACETSEYFSLSESVQFAYVSVEEMTQFVGFLSALFNCLSFSIWETVCDRRVLSVKPGCPTPRSLKGRLERGEDLFSGIIRGLTNQREQYIRDA
jgi:hypothetical protein